MLVDGVRDGRAVDLGEAERAEEPGLEGQAEDPGDAQVTSDIEQAGHDLVPDLPAAGGRIDRDRTDLRQVLPHHVQRAARTAKQTGTFS